MKTTIKSVFIGLIIFAFLSIGACAKDNAKATNSTLVPWQVSGDSVSGTFVISGSYDNYNASQSGGYHWYDTFVDTIIIKKMLGDTLSRVSINSTTYNLAYHDSMTATYTQGPSMFWDTVRFSNNGNNISSSYDHPEGPPGSYAHGSYTGYRIKK